MPGNSRVGCSKVSYPMHATNNADETEDELETIVRDAVEDVELSGYRSAADLRITTQEDGTVRVITMKTLRRGAAHEGRGSFAPEQLAALDEAGVEWERKEDKRFSDNRRPDLVIVTGLTEDESEDERNRTWETEVVDVGKDNSLMLRKTLPDGSTTTFRVTEEDDTEVVRVGSEETVMLRREFSDGSAATFRVNTDEYEDMDALADYVEDPEADEGPEVATDGGVELTSKDEGEELDLSGADLREELSAGEDLRVRFYAPDGERTVDVRVVDVEHESTASGHARVEVEAEVLNTRHGSLLMESEREDFVSGWSGLTASTPGSVTDATVERIVRLEAADVDAGEDEETEAEGEEFESAADRMRRELEEAPEFSAEEAGVPEEGERVAVTYESVYAARDKVLTAEVTRAEHAPGSLGGRLWHVYLAPEGERIERREAYTEGETRPPRRLVIMPEAESVELETRNGGRWNRLTAPATNAEVEVLAEGEEPEREAIGSVAVKVRHSRCGGTTLVTVDSVEDAEDLRGRVLACPHCHGEVNDKGDTRRHELGAEFEFEAIRPLTSHPDMVDPIDDLGDHEVVEHHASPRRWEVYLKAGVKGRNRAHLAEDLGVAEGTVYRHVHDAREAIREVTGQ